MRVGLFGYGAINRLVARVVLERGWEIVGVVDKDPRILGEDVGKLAGLEPLGIKVSNKPEVLKNAEIVLHATGSYLDKIFDQLEALIKMGKDILSTCETLAYPYYRYPELAKKLDELAASRGVTVLGAGINPGFLLDALVIVLSAPFNIVKGVRAVRSLDAGKRRLPFRVKVGIGLDPEVYVNKLKKGELTGHVGYAESVYLVAQSMGIKLSKVKEAQEPVVAKSEVTVAGQTIPAGKVIGIKGYGKGYVNDKEVISIEFHAYVGAQEYEEISIIGKDYNVTWRSTGTPGDLGTASVIVNLAEAVAAYRPGLITMADIVPFRPRLLT